jgi:hypothetical protein
MTYPHFYIIFLFVAGIIAAIALVIAAIVDLVDFFAHKP